MLWWSLSLALAAPPEGASFTYHLERHVDQGKGSYAGYEEKLLSDGLYEVLSVVGDRMKVRARYAWHFSSTEGKIELGDEDRTVAVDLGTRRYTDGIDLDELDGDRIEALSVWFWVPTDVRVGDHVPVLDKIYEVASVDDRAPDGTAHAIRLDGRGKLHRDDVYGVFDYDWKESYWYDGKTGLVLGSRYLESDVGTSEGKAASFRWTEDLDRRPDGYLGLRSPAIMASMPQPTPVGRYLLVALAAVGALIAAPGLLVRWARRPRASIVHPTLGEVRFVKGKAPLQRAASRSGPLDAWVDALVDRTLAAGGEVTVAVAGDAVHGVALVEPDCKVGTVLCADVEVAGHLARHLGRLDWFADLRVDKVPGEPVQLAETWRVMTLDQPAEHAYDPGLVRRMSDADKPAATALLAAASGEKVERWLDAQLNAGDEGFVAMVDGAVVGFGLAGISGEVGRMHGLVVAPAHRGKGIGAELVRARVSALAVMGASTVISEIATWNLASMHLAGEVGFKPSGELYLLTVKPGGEPRVFRR